MHLPAFEKATRVMIYVSFSSEVETRSLIEEAFMRKKTVLVPVTDPDTKAVVLSPLKSLADLAPGHFKGIHEPSIEKREGVDPATVEVAFLPGSVFDRKGGRIGMGGGHFDRLLPKLTNATRIALAFSSQLYKNMLPLEAHDVRMHLIVTENKTLVTGVPLPAGAPGHE